MPNVCRNKTSSYGSLESLNRGKQLGISRKGISQPGGHDQEGPVLPSSSPNLRRPWKYSQHGHGLHQHSVFAEQFLKMVWHKPFLWFSPIVLFPPPLLARLLYPKTPAKTQVSLEITITFPIILPICSPSFLLQLQCNVVIFSREKKIIVPEIIIEEQITYICKESSAKKKTQNQKQHALFLRY